MRKIIFLVVLTSTTLSSLMAANSFSWTTTKNGIFRDNVSFYLNGQSWAKKTKFTYDRGLDAKDDVMLILSQLNEVGVNTIRIYGSPDESDWDGSSNFNNLIKWIEEWNVANPDNGDPNKAIYYLVQISPSDSESALTDNLPENTAASFNRAISVTSNDGSVASLTKVIDDIAGSKYLLGYLIYHELNVSSKYSDWIASVGASGIENFMNEVADAIHNTYASGKLVSHTGDSKDLSNGIYKQLEALDLIDGNVFSKFDMLGFNLYISSDGLLSEDQYYDRIVSRRALSVNDDRGWIIGETGASYDAEANPSSVAAANYTNPQGGANLQIMWEKTKALGNLIGFMLFTVQDNDLLETSNLNAMKQRGHFDYYGAKKFLYFIYPDIINEVSTNNRFHSTVEHNIGIKVVEDASNYTINLNFKNRTSDDKQYLYTIHSDDGSSKQRFSVEIQKEYLTLPAETEFDTVFTIAIPATNKLVAITSNVIEDDTPFMQYSWSREHILGESVSTVAGLNLNTDKLPGEEVSSISNPRINKSKSINSGLIVVKTKQYIQIPEGNWTLRIFNLNGVLMHESEVTSSLINVDHLLPFAIPGMAVYSLVKL